MGGGKMKTSVRGKNQHKIKTVYRNNKIKAQKWNNSRIRQRLLNLIRMSSRAVLFLACFLPQLFFFLISWKWGTRNSFPLDDPVDLVDSGWSKWSCNSQTLSHKELYISSKPTPGRWLTASTGFTANVHMHQWQMPVSTLSWWILDNCSFWVL